MVDAYPDPQRNYFAYIRIKIASTFESGTKGHCNKCFVNFATNYSQNHGVPGLCQSSGIQNNKNTTFRKLDLFPSSGE
jgi:hypothetical protein